MHVYHSDLLLQRGQGALETIDAFNSDIARQRGQGIGSFLSSLYSTVVPLVKTAIGWGTKAAKSETGRRLLGHAKQAAIQSGLNVVGDALSGENIIKSAKRNIRSAKDSVVGKAKEALDEKIKNLSSRGSGAGKKRKMDVTCTDLNNNGSVAKKGLVVPNVGKKSVKLKRKNRKKFFAGARNNKYKKAKGNKKPKKGKKKKKKSKKGKKSRKGKKGRKGSKGKGMNNDIFT